MCKVYTGYCGTSEIEHGLCACTVDNPLAKARGLSLRTGAQPMLYLPLLISSLSGSTRKTSDWLGNIVVTVDASHRPVEFFHLHAGIADYFHP